MISDVRFYLKLLSRRLPVMIILVLMASAVGFAAAYRLPNQYETTAKLLVESAQVRGSNIEVDAGEQLEIIQQRLLTRANLIDVANEVQAFPEMAKMTPDEIVKKMRESTRVRRAGGQNRATTMTISFEGPSPRKATAVVNQYVTIVLEANSDFRTARSVGASSFLEQEVATLADRLDIQNNEIAAFKSANAGALAENLNFRLNRQSLLLERQSRLTRDLERLRTQIETATKIFNQTGNVQGVGRQVITPEEKRLEQLERELRNALSIYSAENPKVKLLETRVKALEDQVEAALQEAAAKPDAGPQVTPLELNLIELQGRAGDLEEELAAAKDELDQLQDNIERTPANSIALSTMLRERDNLQSLYNAAVQNLSTAQRGERIELAAKGERITILEPANVPTTPSSPNRKAIAGMGVGVGLGLAAGLFILLELFNQSVRRPVDVVSGLGITPLSTIPRIETVARRRMRRFAQFFTLAVVILGVPALLWAIDTYYLPLDLIYEKIKDRLI